MINDIQCNANPIYTDEGGLLIICNLLAILDLIAHSLLP